jgi:AAA-like domain
MASKKLSMEGRQRAKLALEQSIYDGQIGLAKAADLAYATVNGFVNCKNITDTNFYKLCGLLNIVPTEVCEQQPDILDAVVNTSCQQPADSSDPAPNTAYIPVINETAWYEKLQELHALIRIQAPAQFGKTSLMRRLLDRAQQFGHLAIFINLAEIDRHVNLADFQIFLHHFIRLIEAEIYENCIDSLMSDEDYQRSVERFGSTKACLKYLERLQDRLSQPLTLGIDRLDLLLAHPDTAYNFFALLRVMNDRSIGGGKWENFRLVLAHSTPAIESFIGISGHQSPFNIGYSIELPEFTPAQVADLASQRNLSLQPAQIERLMQSIGGIPYLIKLTLDRIQKDGVQILAIESSATNNIYQEHLRALAKWLDNSNLRSAMHLAAHNPEATSNLAFKQQCLLHRQGLVVFVNNGVSARCELYRQYFRQTSIDK